MIYPDGEEDEDLDQDWSFWFAMWAVIFSVLCMAWYW